MALSMLLLFLALHFVGDIGLSLIGSSDDRTMVFLKACAYASLFLLVAHASLLLLVLLLLLHVVVDIVTGPRIVERYPERFRAAPYSLGVNQLLKVLVLLVLLLLVH